MTNEIEITNEIEMTSVERAYANGFDIARQIDGSNTINADRAQIERIVAVAETAAEFTDIYENQDWWVVG